MLLGGGRASARGREGAREDRGISRGILGATGPRVSEELLRQVGRAPQDRCLSCLIHKMLGQEKNSNTSALSVCKRHVILLFQFNHETFLLRTPRER